MKHTLAFATALFALTPLPALAEPFTYAPDRCEFTITFPEKPYITTKCTGGDTKECGEVVTYTKVIDIKSSVNFRITCAIDQQEKIPLLSEETMKETVTKMVEESGLEESDAEYAEKDDYKTAAIVSMGVRGEREVFYTGQIWAGKTSVFTLEGDMTGKQHNDADKLFSDVLRSMKPKSQAAVKSAAPTAEKKKAN